jgi:hypothetical protein
MPGGHCWSRLRCYAWAVAPALSVSLVMLAYLGLLFGNDQIEDALLGASQDWSGGSGFANLHTFGLCAWTLLLGFAAWFWARLLIGLARDLPPGLPAAFYEPANRAVLYASLDPVALWVPRLLGALAPVATALAIWRADADADGPTYATGIALALLLAAALFVLIVVMRRPVARKAATRLAPAGAPPKSSPWRDAFMPSSRPAVATYTSFREVNRLAGLIAVAFGLLALVLTIAALVDPVSSGQLFGPVLIVPIGLAGIITGLALIVFFTQEFRVPILTLLVALAIVSGLLADNHALRAVADKAGGANEPRTAPVNLDGAFAKFAKVTETPAAAPDRRLLIVATAGGGIRAAFWTAYVLSRLHDSVEDFDQKLFAISGVSGGSYGAVVYQAMLRTMAQHAPNTGAITAPCKDPTGDLGERVQKVRSAMAQQPPPGAFAGCVPVFLLPDGLGPTLMAALYPDMQQRVLPVAILPDRANALERSWQVAWRNGASGNAGDLMAGPFDRLWDEARPYPVLLLNGTSVLAGRRIITSNLRLADRGSSFANDFADAFDFGALTSLRIAASTAASNSARFPYISPPGTIPGPAGRAVDQIVDGGLFENSGADTALNLYEWLLINAKGFKPEQIGVLQITSDPDLSDSSGQCGAVSSPPGAMRFAADVLSTPTAFYHTREARGAAAMQALWARVRAASSNPANAQGTVVPYFTLRLSRQDARGVAPLGWTLSMAAAQALVKAWPGAGDTTRCNSENLGDLMHGLTPPTGR